MGHVYDISIPDSFMYTWNAMLKALGAALFYVLIIRKVSYRKYHCSGYHKRYHTWYCNDLMELDHSGSKPFMYVITSPFLPTTFSSSSFSLLLSYFFPPSLLFFYPLSFSPTLTSLHLSLPPLHPSSLTSLTYSSCSDLRVSSMNTCCSFSLQ